MKCNANGKLTRQLNISGKHKALLWRGWASSFSKRNNRKIRGAKLCSRSQMGRVEQRLDPGSPDFLSLPAQAEC